MHWHPWSMGPLLSQDKLTATHMSIQRGGVRNLQERSGPRLELMQAKGPIDVLLRFTSGAKICSQGSPSARLHTKASIGRWPKQRGSYMHEATLHSTDYFTVRSKRSSCIVQGLSLADCFTEWQLIAVVHLHLAQILRCACYIGDQPQTQSLFYELRAWPAAQCRKRH